MLYPTTSVTIIIIIMSLLLALGIIVKTSGKKNKTPIPQKPRKYAKTIRSSVRSLSKNPDDFASIRKMAESYYSLGEWAKAHKTFRRLIDSSETTRPSAEIYQKYGISCIKSDLYTQSYNALRESYKLDPGSFETNYYLGMLEQKRGKASLAVQYLRNALSIKPEYRPALRLLGIALAENNNYRAAQKLLEQTVAHNTKDEEVQLAYAKCLVHLGKIEQGIHCYKGLLQSQRFSVNALIALGDIARQSRSNDIAVKYYLRALQIPQAVPHDVLLDTHYHLANIYFETGDIENTTKHLHEIKRINPSYKDVQHRLSLLDNQGLYQYLHATDSTIYSTCEGMLKHIFPHASISTLSRSSGSEYIDFVVEVRDNRRKTLTSYLIRFFRTSNETNDVALRNLNTRFKETEATSAICISAGIFNSAARQYAQTRPIELIDKARTIQILERI